MAAVTVASVIVLFFLPLGVIRNAVGEAAGQPYYDYLQFVQQYPRTVNPSSTLNNFTIHGLWPSNCSNNPVIFCGQNISVDTLLCQLNRTPGLESNLNHSWPDVSKKKNHTGFWTNQFNKHGTCARHTFTTPQAYFEKAVDLYRNFSGEQNLYNLFVRGGIRPGQKSDITRYMNLVQNATKGEPRLWCKENPKENRTKNILKEVVICYDKYATQVIDCPPFEKSPNCEGPTLIPTGKAPLGPTILVLFFSLPLGLIIYKYGPSYIKSKLA